jgi:hypothetical protein
LIANEELAAKFEPNFFVRNSSHMATFAALGRVLLSDQAFKRYSAFVAKQRYCLVMRSR